MRSYTTDLSGRTQREPPLTLAEASQMAEAGFRFAEFNPDANCFRLSKPYELVLLPEKGTLTIRQ
jgi:hypothetical protein